MESAMDNFPVSSSSAGGAVSGTTTTSPDGVISCVVGEYLRRW